MRWQDLNMIVAVCGLTGAQEGDRVRLVSTTDEGHEGWVGETGTVKYVLPGRVRVHYMDDRARLTMEDGTDVLERVT